MRRALLQHTEGVTVRLVRLIEALAVPRPHGRRCSSAEALPRRSVAVYRLAAKIY
jgi:hypothetical protein